MKGLARRGIAPLAGLAAAGGILLAHTLDYVIAYRDPLTRAHVLARTGHGYLPSFAGLAIAAAIAAVVYAVVGGTRDRGASRAGPAALFTRLAALQVGGFVLLETGERFAIGLPAHHLLSSVLPLGIALQVLVAGLGAIVLHAVWRTGRVVARAVAARRRTVRVPRHIAPRSTAMRAPRRTECVRPSAPRSPPLLSGI